MGIAGWIILTVIGLLLFFFVIPTIIMSGFLYKILLVRDKPEKWGRECSMPDDEEYMGMFDEGTAWREKYLSRMTEVSVKSDGLTLRGEYFDFGSDKAVIIIAGRTESCLYCCYFAEPYRRAGYNVLAIDNRAHGLSEGKISSLGYKEYRDVLEWGKLLHDGLGNSKVFIHGICIGSSTGLFALTSDDCPDYMTGMTAEGMYVNFYDTFRQHMIVDHHPLFPFAIETMLWIRVVAGANVVTDGPIKRIPKMKKPILLLHSREDNFSLPGKAEQLFSSCGSEHKQIAWFEHGAHSRIRPVDKEKYDETVIGFLENL